MGTELITWLWQLITEKPLFTIIVIVLIGVVVAIWLRTTDRKQTK